MTFSIIIPVYNGAAHLEHAVRGLRAQSFADWEAVVVDDGSTDGTGGIAERLAAEDARIRVFHQPNGGVSVARNRGLAEARGDWIAWLDADDAWVDGALARLAALVAAHPDCDALVMPDVADLSAGDTAGRTDTAARVLTGAAAFDRLYVDPATCGMFWTCWRFVMRRTSALPQFRARVIHEDVDVLPRHVRTLARVAISDERLYRYFEARDGAATQLVTPRRVRDILDVTANNFGQGFDAMLAYNLWGYYKAAKAFGEPERSELLAEFHRHRDWLAAVRLPRRTAWLKRLYARFLV